MITISDARRSSQGTQLHFAPVLLNTEMVRHFYYQTKHGSAVRHANAGT